MSTVRAAAADVSMKADESRSAASWNSLSLYAAAGLVP